MILFVCYLYISLQLFYSYFVFPTMYFLNGEWLVIVFMQFIIVSTVLIRDLVISAYLDKVGFGVFIIFLLLNHSFLSLSLSLSSLICLLKASGLT